MEQDKNDRLAELFNQARNETPKISFKETQQQFLKATGSSASFSGGQTITKLVTVKSIIMSIVAISTLVIGSVLLFSDKAEILQTENAAITEIKELHPKEKTSEQADKEFLTFNKDEKITTLVEREEVEKPMLGKVVSSSKEIKKPINKYDNDLANKKVETDTTYHFPVLSAAEIKANNKQKGKMRKMNSKLEAFGFLKINKGGVQLSGEKIKVEDFQIKQTEVSNIQYRTFLFDLLINNKKEEFLMAKPNQAEWLNSDLKEKDELQKKYFSNPIYNDYPVVNISRKGAEMYCVWLAEEINKAQEKKLKGQKVFVSLPSINQWKYAALGGKNNTYGWNYMETRQNSRGCFQANYKYLPKIDTVPITGCEVKYPNALTTSGILLGENTYTVKVNSYNPNTFGLYCMSGNVAEMVTYEDGTIGALGGSWTSLPDEIKINAPDKYKGVSTPNVNIGFRPLMTYLGRGNYKTTFTPPGTVKMDDSTYIDKTEISNFMWLEYLSWQEKNYGKESEELKKSLPDTLVWRSVGYNKPLETHYLRHPAYGNYPVVGISYEQAVAYCKWRAARVKTLFNLSRQKNKKVFYPLNFEYRLPTKKEWEAAANVGYSDKVAKKMKNRELSNFHSTVNDTINKNDVNSIDVTAPVQSYYPNKLGCYNLMGNVAEMTAEKGVAKGGSYLQTEKEVTVKKDFEYTKPERWLGFRCVFHVLK